MPYEYQHTSFDRVSAAIDTWLLLVLDKDFYPVRQALRALPEELQHPALHLMEGLHRVQRDDQDRASLIAAAERRNRRPTALYRAAAFFIAARGIFDAAVRTFNDTSRKSRAALSGYLVPAGKGQHPSKAGFECADSRCATEASGESTGDAFGHRSPGILDAIAPNLGGLGEGAKKTLRLAISARTPWINAAPHFGCSALRGVYQSCRKTDGTGGMNALQLEDYNYGRQYEWLVETVEERIGDEGFGAYQKLCLDLQGTDDEKFVNAMAVELGLIVGKMTGEYLQACLNGLDYRPVLVVSNADPGRSVILFDPRQQRFRRLPAASFAWPFYLSGVDRVLGLGASRSAAQAEVPFPYEFPALMGPLERAKKRTQLKPIAAAAVGARPPKF